MVNYRKAPDPKIEGFHVLYMVTFMNIVQSVCALVSGQGGALAFLSQLHEFAPSLRWDFYPTIPLSTFAVPSHLLPVGEILTGLDK